MEKLIGKKILITGGSGFIGLALTNALKEKNHVSVVSSKGDFPSGVKHIKADLTKKESLRFLKDGNFDYIFHFAGNTDHGRALSDPEFDLSINFLSTFYILEKIKNFKKKPKFIFSSTVLVYGNSKGILSEESSLTNPISNHGAAKLAAEKYIVSFWRQYGIPAVIFRIFSVYGPGLRRQIVFDFIKKLSSNPYQLEIIGTGKESRDLIFINDLIKNILKVAEFADYNAEIYNMGTGKSYTTTQIARTVAAAMHIKPKLFFSKKIRSFDVANTTADVKKIRKLGCKTNTTLANGVRQTVRWYMNNC